MVLEGEKGPQLENKFWGNRQMLIFRRDGTDFWLLWWAMKSLSFRLHHLEATAIPELRSCVLSWKGGKWVTPLAFKPVDLRNISLEISPLSPSFCLFKQFYSKEDTGVQILLLTVLGGRKCVFLLLVSLFYQPFIFEGTATRSLEMPWSKILVVPFLLDHVWSPRSSFPLTYPHFLRYQGRSK